MRYLVCGGRDYTNGHKVALILGALLKPGDVVIQGGARGADTLAKTAAVVMGIDIEEFTADWESHGRAAGPIRNKRMLDEGKPDRVIAFPGGKGTANMVRQAKARGIEVLEVPA